jgi:plastocyanin
MLLKTAARRHARTLSVLVAAALFAAPALADTEVTIEIKDHKFSPAEIKVPADTAIKLTVKNNDPTPEEFESHSMKVEKVIAGNTSATIRIKPLAKGTYKFVGEFNEATAQGVLIAE